MFFFKSIKIKNQYYATWVLIFFLAALFAASDSCFVLFNPTRATFLGLGMDPFWSKVATGLMVGVYVIAIDYALSIFYPNAINELITAGRERSRDGARWSIALLTLLFCVFQIYVTIQVSIQLRHTAASMIVEKPVTTSVDSVVSVQAAAQKAMAAALSRQIDRAESAKTAAVSRSQNNRELQRLNGSGNGWAAQKLHEAARQAGSKYEGTLKSMNSQYTTLLSQNAQNIAIVAQATADQNKWRQTNYETQTGSLANFFLYFAIVATGIQCFAGLMMGLYMALFGLGNAQRMTPAQKTPVAVVATADSKKTGGDTTAAVATVSTTDTKESGVTATEDEVKKEKVWTESLTSTDLDGVSYSPTEIFSARRNILTYWKRAFTSKTPEARIENQQKTLTFKNLLEMTGLRVTLLDDGTGAISF